MAAGSEPKLKEREYCPESPLNYKSACLSIRHAEQLIRHQHVAIYLATTLRPLGQRCPEDTDYYRQNRLSHVIPNSPTASARCVRPRPARGY